MSTSQETIAEKTPSSWLPGDASQPIAGAMAPMNSGMSGDAWGKWLRILLFDWLPNRESLGCEEVSPPTLEAIGTASWLATQFMEQSMPAPQSMVMDPNGGIVFSRRCDGGQESVHVWEDGTAEYMRFRDASVVTRFSYPAPVRA